MTDLDGDFEDYYQCTYCKAYVSFESLAGSGYICIGCLEEIIKEKDTQDA